MPNKVVIGPTQVGKSSFEMERLRQLRSDEAAVVLDPHGTIVHELIDQRFFR